MNVGFASGITRTKLPGFPLSIFSKTLRSLDFGELELGKTIEADACGLFCALIKREIFDQLQKSYFV